MYFRINMAEMTVQLLLDFGKELGSPYYSAYVGNVQYMEEPTAHT